MALTIEIPIEQLAKALKKLSDSERVKLKSLVGEEWFVKEESVRLVQDLVKKSRKEHEEGNSHNYEDIIADSKKKYGL